MRISKSEKATTISIINHGGDYAKTEALLKRALAMREKIYGSEHPDVVTTRENLAALHREK